MKFSIKHENFKNNYGENILKLRGIEDIESFLHPTDESLQSWRDLDNIMNGLDLIFSLKGKERIGLVVDCDTDGFTSAAIIYQYLKRKMPDLDIKYYIHSGKAHGLEEHWEEIRDENFSLVIVPDAGSNDAQYAQEIDCPVLVIDHHLVDNIDFSPNMVVINNQLSKQYRNKELSGAGLVYQFCRALDYYWNSDWAKDYLDIAAVGIDGDMMSGLQEENQWFWKNGFANIQNVFLKELLYKQSFSMGGKVNPISVAFYIVPLINAMVRTGTLEEKKRMFMSFINPYEKVESHKRGAHGTLEFVYIESVRECTNAKSKQNNALNSVITSIEAKIYKYDLLSNKVLFIRLDEDDDFPSELNGLVAMKLSAAFKKPTIVARLNNEGYIRGSARGLNQCALTSFKEFLLDSGYFEYAYGHDNAFGCSIKNEDLSAFHSYANSKLDGIDFGQNEYNVDFVRRALDNDIADIVYDLEDYEDCWASQNEQPKIAITDLFIEKNEIQAIGKNKDTLKFTKNGITYIKFFAKSLIEDLNSFNVIKMDIVGKTNVNEWNGRYTPQIMIEDMNFSDGEFAF